jgi:hypothetical protein
MREWSESCESGVSHARVEWVMREWSEVCESGVSHARVE